MSDNKQEHWHRRLLEGRAGMFAVVCTVGILIGGLVEIIPMYTLAPDAEAAAEIPPYTPLELAGRDIYIREGCYNCHSQMVRPMYAETLRYGEWSRSAEYTHDRPFQLGSRRIGPDLAREGTAQIGRPDAWHYEHFRDPRSVQPGSIMPNYPWLYRRHLDPDDVQRSVRTMQRLGVPYDDATVSNVEALMDEQANEIVENLRAVGFDPDPREEVIALIAYMQRLGTHRPQGRE